MITSTLHKSIAVILLLCFLLVLLPVSILAEEFSDIPEDWSKAAILNAIKNGLLEGSNGKISPHESLTRAQMAAVISRAFGASKTASLADYKDISSDMWYYDCMSKAVHMQVIEGYGGRLNPTAFMTREEAFTVLARAFKLPEASDKELDAFSDKAQISKWAKGPIASLVSGGYLTGSGGRLNPRKCITRAELAKIMDNLVKAYFNVKGTYSNDVVGNAMINVPGVTLKNVTIKGDLIIGDGVGEGEVTLDGVVVEGRTLIRGGGANSIRVIGNSQLTSIIIARVDGEIRVYSEDGTQIGEFAVDGDSDVIIEGNVQNVVILSDDVSVTVNGGAIGSVAIEGENSTFSVGPGSSIGTIAVESENAVITVSEGSETGKIIVNGDGASISGDGEIGTVMANAGNVTVTTEGTAVTAGRGTRDIIAGTVAVPPGSTVVIPRKAAAVYTGTGGSSGPAPLPSISVDSISDITLLKTQSEEVIVSTTPSAVTITAVSGDPTVAGVAVEGNKITVTGLQAGTANIAVSITSSGYSTASVNFKVTVNTPIISTASTTISKNSVNPNVLIKLSNSAFSPDAATMDKWTIDTGTTGLVVGAIIRISDSQVRIIFLGTANDGSISILANAAALGGFVQSNEIELMVAEATVPGELKISPPSSSPGDVKSIYLEYYPRETLENGTVIFELPEGFAADTDDMVGITSAGPYITLTEDNISNSGRTVTIKNIDLEYQPLSTPGDPIALWLFSKTIPAEGTYTFSAKADADGDRVQKGLSPGTGLECITFTSQPAPISDLRATPGDGSVMLRFSKPIGATNVVLEQSIDFDNNYTTVAAVSITAESDSCTVTGLTNGNIYNYRLVVTGGVHDGISNIATAIPTKVDADRSSSEMSLVTGGDTSTATINVTLRDKNGELVTTKDALVIVVYTFDSIEFKLNDLPPYGGADCYHFTFSRSELVNGVFEITVTMPSDPPYFSLYIENTDSGIISSYYFHE